MGSPEPVLPPPPPPHPLPPVSSEHESPLYIRICHHPRANKNDEIICLDETETDSPDLEPEPGISSHPERPPADDFVNFGYQRPWAPFPTRPDSEIAAHIVENHLGKDQINMLLRGMHGPNVCCVLIYQKGLKAEQR
jgi:hypothetical protein